MSKRTAGPDYEYANSSDEDSAPPPTPLGFGPPAPPKPPTDAEIYAEQLRQEANPNGTRTSTRVKRITTSRFPGLTKLFFSETPSTDKRLRKVHSNPNVYVIDNFLTKIELDHIAARCDLDIPIQTDYSQETIMKEEEQEQEQTALLETTTVEPTLETSVQPTPTDHTQQHPPAPSLPPPPPPTQQIPRQQPQPVMKLDEPFGKPEPAGSALLPLAQPNLQSEQQPVPVVPVVPIVAQPIPIAQPQMQSFATQPPAPLSQLHPQQTQEPYPLQTGQPLLAPAEAQPVKVKKPRKKKQKKAAPPDEFGLRLAAALNASPIKSIPIRPGNTDGGAVAGAAVATTTDTTTTATTTTTTKPTPTPIIPQTPLPPPPLQPVTQFYVLGSPPKPPTLPKPPSTEPLTSPYLQGGGGVKTGSPVKKNKTFKKSYTDDSTTLTRNAEDMNRTSTFTYFTKMEDSKIAALEEKAASFCGTTIERVEPLQVVKYNPGQFFGAHHDTGVLFDDGSVEFPKNPPRRVCTFFVYLNDVPLDSGGSTRFPLLKDSDGKVLEVQPVKGSAVLWSNITKEGDVDPLTVHEGVAITRGKKYGMNIWVTD